MPQLETWAIGPRWAVVLVYFLALWVGPFMGPFHCAAKHADNQWKRLPTWKYRQQIICCGKKTCPSLMFPLACHPIVLFTKT